MDQDYLTTKQVSVLLAVEPRTVRSWIVNGSIKPAFITPGGHSRLAMAEVERLLGNEGKLNASIQVRDK